MGIRDGFRALFAPKAPEVSHGEAWTIIDMPPEQPASLAKASDLLNSNPMVLPWPQVPMFDGYGALAGITSVKEIMGMKPGQVWRSQPHLRTVVDFLASNVSQLGLHTFIRKTEDDRVRTRDDPAALLFKRPNAAMTGTEVIHALVADLALYDRAYWWLKKDPTAPAGWILIPVWASWVTNWSDGNQYQPDYYYVQNPGGGPKQRIPAAEMLVFHGWDAMNADDGYTKVDTLKAIIAEQVHAYAYRGQQWRNGGRVGHVITRPAGHTWSDTAEQRFTEAWKSKHTGDGESVGAVPILQDGMTMQRVGFSAKEEDFVEGTKLALVTVAGVYHVNPTMLGMLDNANYSNVREFRRMLYGDTLGPLLKRIIDRINTFLLPRIGSDPDAYMEFNIGAKLQGSFEEQAAVSSASTGAPWMTRNETRRMNNLPAVEGGDDLVTPLNVIVGGQASPRDSAPPKSAYTVKRKSGGGVQIKISAAAKGDAEGRVAEAEQVLTSFYKRQGAAVQSNIGAGRDDYFDSDRWDKELGDDLYALGIDLSGAVAGEVLEELGFKPDDYSPERTYAFLQAVATSRAGMINSTTKAQLEEALALADDFADEEGLTPADVFAKAVEERAPLGAMTFATTMAAFATTEVAKQTTGDNATKTWAVRSRNPRPEHSAMDGETVGINEGFSNGANWPGDPVLGAEGVAGCQCDVIVTIDA